MDHFYTNIQGWFTFPRFYAQIVNESKDFYHFVEVGAWKGKSSVYMAVEIANSNKKIKFDCVDTWEGDLDITASMDEPLLKIPDGLYKHFLTNIEPVKDYITPIRNTSVNASKLYEDASLDFVFIDGAHDYDSVKTDIIHWLPKIKKGSILAGHDYKHLPVKQALSDTLSSGFADYGEDVWFYKKQ